MKGVILDVRSMPKKGSFSQEALVRDKGGYRTKCVVEDVEKKVYIHMSLRRMIVVAINCKLMLGAVGPQQGGRQRRRALGIGPYSKGSRSRLPD